MEDVRCILPSDLVNLRQAADRTGVAVETIRRWIFEGKGRHRKRLQTYRRPGRDNAEMVLVSEAEVAALNKMRDRAHRAVPISTLSANASNMLRQLRDMRMERTGIAITLNDLSEIVLAEALRREEATKPPVLPASTEVVE